MTEGQGAALLLITVTTLDAAIAFLILGEAGAALACVLLIAVGLTLALLTGRKAVR